MREFYINFDEPSKPAGVVILEGVEYPVFSVLDIPGPDDSRAMQIDEDLRAAKTDAQRDDRLREQVRILAPDIPGDLLTRIGGDALVELVQKITVIGGVRSASDELNDMAQRGREESGYDPAVVEAKFREAQRIVRQRYPDMPDEEFYRLTLRQLFRLAWISTAA